MKLLLSSPCGTVLGMLGLETGQDVYIGDWASRGTQSIPLVYGLVGGQRVAWIDGEEAEVRQALDMVLQGPGNRQPLEGQKWAARGS